MEFPDINMWTILIFWIYTLCIVIMTLQVVDWVEHDPDNSKHLKEACWGIGALILLPIFIFNVYQIFNDQGGFLFWPLEGDGKTFYYSVSIGVTSMILIMMIVFGMQI